MAVVYTYTERMAFELGLQAAKTAVGFAEFITSEEQDAIRGIIEQRATEQFPEMRVRNRQERTLKT